MEVEWTGDGEGIVDADAEDRLTDLARSADRIARDERDRRRHLDEASS